MEVVRDSGFERLLNQLPGEIQRLYQRQESLFRLDWQDPRLHAKKLHACTGVYSFRVTSRYRVLFYFIAPDRAVFFEIDHRKDAYRNV